MIILSDCIATAIFWGNITLDLNEQLEKLFDLHNDDEFCSFSDESD